MKLKNIIGASLVPLNILLFFFLLAESKIIVPSWLQVFGRMHPVMLHFPIVLVLFYASFVLFTPKSLKQQDWYTHLMDVLLLSAAVTASLTALMGLLLSKEQGYDPDAIAWHKYTGAATSFALFGLYSFRGWMQTHINMSRVLVISTTVVLIVAGDLGGSITHGNNFVLAPVTPNSIKPAVAFEDAYVYADLVQPVLEEKCTSCHNSSKEKGELVMETKDLLLKGGKDGKLWDTTQPDMGLLMKRIHLPVEEKEHMPPDGKPQLTDEEKEILFAWIKEGASFTQKVTELQPTDTLNVIAARRLKQSADEQFDFAAADEKEVQKLSNNNRVVTPLALGSPALVVNFYNKPFYTAKSLEELKPVQDQITDINLGHMPVKDDDLKILSSFKNLRRLNLDFSDVTGATLSSLKNLQSLKTLSLSGTPIQASRLTVLQSFPKLKHVYVWATSVTDANVQALEKQNRSIAWFTGFKGGNIILKLTAPILDNDQLVITQPQKLKLKSFMPGINIRYTTNGKDPDSLTSPLYDTSVTLSSEVTIKAKAFKPGWISSDVIEQHFFKSTYVADSAQLLTPLDVKYRANGARSLIDLDKSDLNFANGKWVGYRQNDMMALLYFGQPIKAQSVTFSTLLNTSGYIFPPTRIDVWGGTDKNNLKLLGTIIPTQPTKDQTAVVNVPLTVSFAPIIVKYIKFLAVPVHKLPDWHQGKGQKAWVFMDEVFVN